MASKGPKSDATTKVATKAAPVAAKVAKPEIKNTAPVVGASPAVTAPVVAAAPAAKPVAAKASTPKPVTPKALAPSTMASPKPAVEAPAVTAPAARAVAAEPVITPAAAPAPAFEAITPKATTKTVPVASKKETFMENTIHTATEKTQALFVDMNERTKAAMEKSTQLFADMNDLSKGNVEALVESSKIAAKGIETMGQEAAEFTRKTFEGATAAMRNMASVKTPADFMKLQSDFVRNAFDSMVAET